MDKPMMSESEIEIVDRLIEELKPKNCLEWGSGGSTIYFPRKHNCIKLWKSIEHDGKYHDMIKNSIENSVQLVHAPIDEYLSVALGKYDFILIDGLMRQECLMYSQNLLNKGGVILMHDSGRSEYQKPIRNWEGKSEKLIDGELQVTGFAHRGLHKFWL